MQWTASNRWATCSRVCVGYETRRYLGGSTRPRARCRLVFRSGYSTIRAGALLSRPERSHSEIPSWLAAVRAGESKKATDLKVLDLTGITSFTDYFLVCTGANQRQIQAISDEIGQKLKERGEYPISVEGYKDGEWVLVDYGDFVVHIFSPRARAYYDLERLWRNAKNVAIPAA
ncbi:MAG: ribosome silencing factor [Acidobacteriia bacterium]|nr:ribosome silencing factor [Terriglobia bacterium]